MDSSSSRSAKERPRTQPSARIPGARDKADTGPCPFGSRCRSNEPGEGPRMGRAFRGRAVWRKALRCHGYMTEHAKSEPSTDRGRPAAPPPPPAWRNWLLVVGLVVSVLILFWPQSEPSVSELSYTEFLSRVEAGHVKTAVIDPGGAVSGTLESGGDYATQIPIALQDPGLAEQLQASGVEITGKGEPGATLLSVLLSLLPFLLLIGVWVYIGRRAQRQLAGGIGGIID